MKLNRECCYCSIRLESLLHSYRIGCSADTANDAQFIMVSTSAAGIIIGQNYYSYKGDGYSGWYDDSYESKSIEHSKPSPKAIRFIVWLVAKYFYYNLLYLLFVPIYFAIEYTALNRASFFALLPSQAHAPLNLFLTSFLTIKSCFINGLSYLCAHWPDYVSFISGHV